MNALSLFAQRNTDEYGMAGMSYINTQYFINYLLLAYGIYERPELPPGAVEKDRRDYGLIGNMRSVALVSKDGTIDYCSMPNMDSPTVFAALLDDEKGGFFSDKNNDRRKK